MCDYQSHTSVLHTRGVKYPSLFAPFCEGPGVVSPGRTILPTTLVEANLPWALPSSSSTPPPDTPSLPSLFIGGRGTTPEFAFFQFQMLLGEFKGILEMKLALQ
jgi:hypothetical protein